jgi:type II secretory pathway pseudopilin PulG
MTRHADQGFTLAETLIALWVVSMALACVLAGFALLSRFDRSIQGQTAVRRTADAAVTSMRQAVATGEALSVKSFSGDARRLQYACGPGGELSSPRLCTLKAPKGWSLSYVSEAGIYKAWPNSTDDASPQLLEALILQDERGTTRGVVRIRVEQAPDCQFDTISRTCREEPK